MCFVCLLNILNLFFMMNKFKIFNIEFLLGLIYTTKYRNKLIIFVYKLKNIKKLFGSL